MLLFALSQMSRTFSRLVLLAVGALHPAYLSCKAVHSRSPRDYVRWMMYWVVFAAFLSVEPLADLVFCCFLPLYAELKIAFVFWLQSSTTRGASLVFRKLLLPEFTKREKEIDAHLGQLHTRASQVGASTARYVTQVVMQTVFSHIRDNYSIADLVSSDLKLNLFDPVGEGSSSLEDPSEMALGDQGGRRRPHRRADDDAKRRKISTNTL
ncbi:hypothetical protein V5799_026566 [Amblyomma americanum]|uniref:Receptor expression-enhancing protein n=1 Tax=Amblyomma americanum TaxID=6943 RepID=A0AAQ4DI85_AMBAM